MADSVSGKELAIRRLTHLEPGVLAQLKCYGAESLGGAALDEWTLPAVAGCGILYVGLLREQIIGSAQLISCVSDGDIYMDVFYIRPAFRRRGMGYGLLEGVKELLAGEGYDRVLVTLDPDNDAAVALYRACGFMQIAHLPDHYGEGRHRLMLAADLGAATRDD